LPGTTIGTSVTVANSLYALREIVDIREQNEITLNFPYMVLEPYLNCQSQQFSGQVRITVLNDLRCPETVAQQVGLQLFWTPGPDFELQVPCHPQQVGFSAVNPQTDQQEVVVKSGIAEGEIRSINTRWSQCSVGEHFLSIKQLLNRLSQCVMSGSNPVNTANSFALFPWFVGMTTINKTTGAISYPQYYGDAYSLLAPMYMFYRGGARVWFSDDVTDKHRNMQNHPTLMAYSGATTPLAINTTIAGLPNVSITPVVGGSTVPYQGVNCNDLGVGSVYGEFPYYCRTPVSLVRVFDGVNSGSAIYASPDCPSSTCVVASGPTAFGATGILQRSFADDFTLSFFIGCPPLYSTYA